MSAIPAPVARPLHGSIALKALMALTGLILFGFVFIHMVGNLQLYSGPEKINHYAAFLKGTPAILWGFRCTLLAAVALHAYAAFKLWRRNLAARPVGYAHQSFQAATITSRTMYWTGPILGIFIVYHLLHLTVGAVHPSFDHLNVYANVVTAFSNPAVSIFYVVAMFALGFHLFHGAVSLFQTLGLRTPKYEKPLKAIVLIVSTVIVAADISFPIAVLTGLVK